MCFFPSNKLKLFKCRNSSRVHPRPYSVNPWMFSLNFIVIDLCLCLCLSHAHTFYVSILLHFGCINLDLVMEILIGKEQVLDKAFPTHCLCLFHHRCCCLLGPLLFFCFCHCKLLLVVLWYYCLLLFIFLYLLLCSLGFSDIVVWSYSGDLYLLPFHQLFLFQILTVSFPLQHLSGDCCSSLAEV